MAKSKDSVSGEANRTWKKGKVHQYPIGKAMTLFYSYLVTEHTYEDTSSGYDTTQTNLIWEVLLYTDTSFSAVFWLVFCFVFFFEVKHT